MKNKENKFDKIYIKDNTLEIAAKKQWQTPRLDVLSTTKTEFNLGIGTDGGIEAGTNAS